MAQMCGAWRQNGCSRLCCVNNLEQPFARVLMTVLDTCLTFFLYDEDCLANENVRAQM